MRFSTMSRQRKGHSGRALSTVAMLLLGAAVAPVVQAQLPVVHGRVVSADSATPIGASARVVVDWGGMVDTLAVDDSGRFSGATAPTVGDSLQVTVLAGDAFHPARLRVSTEEPSEEVMVVAVPRWWVIRAGTFAGDTVAISPSAALAGSGEHFARVAEASSAPLRGLVGWPVARIPIPLSIRRTSGSRISDADSAALWATLHSFEGAIGATMFRPADDSTVQRLGWGIEVHVDPRIDGSGLTFDTWGNDGLLFDASIAVRHVEDFGDPSILHHELLHALGFGHTREWPSIMTHTVSATAMTVDDVAYAQLLLRVGELQRTLRTRYGVVAAAEGERWAASNPAYRLSTSRRSSVHPSTW